jgi:hypothetical protein
MMSTRTSVPSARAISTSCFSPGGRDSTRAVARAGGQPDLDQQLRRLRGHRPAVESAQRPAAGRLTAEEQVVDDGQVLGEVQLLVDQLTPAAVASAGPANRTGWPSSRTSPASGW